MVDFALGGELERLLTSWSDAGVSGRAASRLLSQRIGGIELDERTMLKWLRSVRSDAAA